jgi:DNA-binding PadR family transcriptional regulator
MITKERIIEKYKSMDDSQILDLHRTTHTLSDLGREALADVLKERGGIEKLIADRNKSIEIEREKFNLKSYFSQKYKEGIPAELIKLSSEILDRNQLAELHQQYESELEYEKKDKSINVRTVLGSIGGMVIGGILGGIFWGGQLIYSGHIFYLFAIALAVLNYGIIRLITGQSKENPVVLVFSALGIGISLLIGFELYGIFGYLGRQ